MKTVKLFTGIVVVFMFLLPSALFGQTTAITPTETLVLFNGKDLSSFYSWLVDHHYQDPNRVVTVVDQVDGAPAIRVSGEDWGGFATKENYKNYRLVVELRWGLLTWGDRADKTRDSGILLHCRGRDGNTGRDFNGPWMRSVEAQLIEGGIGDFILVAGFDESGQRLNPSLKSVVSKDRDGETVYDPKGTVTNFTSGRINWYGRDPDWKDVLGFRGKNDVESRFGEWTRVEVICDEGKITNIVNGKVVNVATDSIFTEGRIMFQSEGAEVFFRKIELQPLD